MTKPKPKPPLTPYKRPPRRTMPKSSRCGVPNTAKSLTMKQELYCQHRASGRTGTEAYTLAGYASRGNTALNEIHHLNHAPAICSRIAVLLERYAKEAGITLMGLVAELEQCRARAVKSMNAGAEVAAIMSKAKLMGFLVDKVEDVTQRKPVGQPTLKTEITEAEWTEMVHAPKLLPPPSTNGGGNGQTH